MQFGVKFVVIYNLRHYVDKVCQRYLHHFTYFKNFVSFENYSIIFIIILLSFKVILCYFLNGLSTLRSHFNLEEIFAAFLLVDQIDGGRRG